MVTKQQRKMNNKAATLSLHSGPNGHFK
jgi:hypothetical protein